MLFASNQRDLLRPRPAICLLVLVSLIFGIKQKMEMKLYGYNDEETIP